MALASMSVVIESEPYWKEKPEDQNVGVSEDVTFVCDADGKPAPNRVDWYVNGKLLETRMLQSNPRISVNNKVMQINNVIASDTSVFACNVTNKHGYVWTNFYLNVLGAFFRFELTFINENKKRMNLISK
jgi:neuronal cell adhesion protein